MSDREDIHDLDLDFGDESDDSRPGDGLYEDFFDHGDHGRTSNFFLPLDASPEHNNHHQDDAPRYYRQNTPPRPVVPVYINPAPPPLDHHHNHVDVVAPQQQQSPGVVVLTQPPIQWYQRGTDQEFTIRSTTPFSGYTLALMFAPDSGGSVFEPVCNTRKTGNGLTHNTRNDTRDNNQHLTVRPKIMVCTQKGGRLFVLQLTLSSGEVVRSRPFSVKNRQPKPNTFKSDAKRAIHQLQWCPTTQTCHLCLQSVHNGHSATCVIRTLLAIGV